MWRGRVGREPHLDAALLRWQRGDVARAAADAAARQILESRDRAQQRGLAAARGADDDRELAVGNVDRHVAQYLGLADAFARGCDRQVRHGSAPRRAAVQCTVALAAACVGAVRAPALAKTTRRTPTAAEGVR